MSSRPKPHEHRWTRHDKDGSMQRTCLACGRHETYRQMAPWHNPRTFQPGWYAAGEGPTRFR